MSGHGSYVILVLPISFEVSNRPNAKWIRETNKIPLRQRLPQVRKHFLKSSNQQMSIIISYKFSMFVCSWWFHGIVTVIIELNLMACA